MEFKDWITQKYIDWRGNFVGNDHSISAFARLMGVHQAIVSRWMSGEKKPGIKNAIEIAKIYPEIYGVLGFKKPVSESAAKAFSFMPPEEQERFLSAALEAIDTISAQGIDPNSPEALRIRIETFERWNLDVE